MNLQEIIIYAAMLLILTVFFSYFFARENTSYVLGFIAAVIITNFSMMKVMIK